MRKDVSIRTQVKAWVKADGKVVVHFENLHFTIVKGYINCLLVVLFLHLSFSYFHIFNF